MDRLRVLVVGHSILHPRQAGLWRAIADQGHVVHAIGPDQWGDEAFHKEEYPGKGGGSYHAHPMPGRGASLLTWRPYGVGPLLRVLPAMDVVYVVQEPWTVLARDEVTRARGHGLPAALFSWENRSDLPDAWDPAWAQRERELYLDYGDALRLCIGGNPRAAQRMQARGAPKVAVCPQTGVDLNLFKPSQDTPKATFALYAGRLVPEKGLSFVEDACRALNLTLTVHGDRGPWRPQGWARHEPWNPSWTSLPSVYNAAEVHVSHPIARGTGYQEQYGYAYLEAMACGLPSLASTNGSLPELFGSSPMVLIKEDDAEQLKDYLTGLARSHAARRDVGQAGRAWVQEHVSLPVIAARLVGLLRSVVESAPSASADAPPPTPPTPAGPPLAGSGTLGVGL